MKVKIEVDNYKIESTDTGFKIEVYIGIDVFGRVNFREINKFAKLEDAIKSIPKRRRK